MQFGHNISIPKLLEFTKKIYPGLQGSFENADIGCQRGEGALQANIDIGWQNM